MLTSQEVDDRRTVVGAADAILLTRVSDRDQTALRTLYAQYKTVVFRFIARLTRDEAIAEEITNEVFLEVWQSAGRFEGRSKVKTWLLSIARNRAISSMRKKKESPWDENAACELPDEGDNPEVATQKSDKSLMMRECLSELSAIHAEIIDLVYYHEMSIAEVGDVLGISTATVKTRMFYARKKLSEVLMARGIDRGWP